MRLLLRAIAACSAILGSSANAAWYEAKSRHFMIYADEKPSVLQRYAARLEKFDQAVRIVRKMDDPPVGDGGRVAIYVLPTSDAVSKLASIKGAAGLYIPRASGSVAFVPRDTGGNQEWDMTPSIVFFHEYAHHLMLQNTDAALPPWLVEGFAEFFSTAQFEPKGGVELGKPAVHRVAGLYLSAKPDMTVLLGPGLTKATIEQLDAFYGWSWVLTHYLTFDEKRKGQLVSYVTAINRGDNLIEAARNIFGDFKRLDRDTNQYLHVNRFSYLTINAPSLNQISVDLRPLRPGEIAIMPSVIRSKRGVDAKEAASVQAIARGVAAQYPNDPAVQTALAEAEFDAKDYHAAEAAADRAIRADPNFAKALIYKGRAEMELAAAKPNSDWNAIRSLFAKANRLDTENAEPLMLFYESFLRSGQPPTDDARKGLQYALLLSPQDRSLRFMAVQQLIHDGQLAEARDEFAPLAFDPHANNSRDLARKVMDALAANNAKAALSALNEQAKLPDDSGV